MGMGARIADTYRRANEWFGRHGIILALLMWLVVPAVVGGAMISLALQLWWFWYWFRWFGVAGVLLLTWVAVCLGLAAIRFRRSPTAQTAVAPAAPLGQKTEPPAPDYRIWKRREVYNVYELAALVANVDPEFRPFTPEERSYQRLIMDHLQNKKLKYKKVERISFMGDAYYEPLTEASNIERATAITWAKENGFDLSALS